MVLTRFPGATLPISTYAAVLSAVTDDTPGEIEDNAISASGHRVLQLADRAGVLVTFSRRQFTLLLSVVRATQAEQNRIRNFRTAD